MCMAIYTDIKVVYLKHIFLGEIVFLYAKTTFLGKFVLHQHYQDLGVVSKLD